MDVSQAIQPKSDQLNADDLIAAPLTAKIENVEVKSTPDQPISVWLVGNPRPYKPCKSMSRVMATAWGTNASNWIGQSLTLYRDPTVKWAGVEVGGIRISHMGGIDQPLQLSLTATRGKRSKYTVNPLVIQHYSEDQFTAGLPAMSDAILSGKMTHEQVIERCEQTAPLTEQQKQQINNIKPQQTEQF